MERAKYNKYNAFKDIIRPDITKILLMFFQILFSKLINNIRYKNNIKTKI